MNSIFNRIAFTPGR